MDQYITMYLDALHGRSMDTTTRERVREMLRTTTPDVILRRLGGRAYYDYNAMIMKQPWNRLERPVIFPRRFAEYFAIRSSVYSACIPGGEGVIAIQRIPGGVLFGPFFGFPEVWNEDYTYVWSTRLKRREEYGINSMYLPYITVGHKRIPNVLRFVNSISTADAALEKKLLRKYARTSTTALPFIPSSAQNCESRFETADDGSDVVFYRTTRAVSPGEELIISYGNGYLQKNFEKGLLRLLG